MIKIIDHFTIKRGATSDGTKVTVYGQPKLHKSMGEYGLAFRLVITYANQDLIVLCYMSYDRGTVTASARPIGHTNQNINTNHSFSLDMGWILEQYPVFHELMAKYERVSDSLHTPTGMP